MKRPLVIIAAGGAWLASGCGPKENPPIPGNPPPPEEPIPTNPPPLTGATLPPQDPNLPTWDAVPSGHPEGATNPPIPVLIVRPDGTCYKRWQSPMAVKMGPGSFDPHVEDCDAASGACGTQIQCTEDAVPLLASLPPKTP